MGSVTLRLCVTSIGLWVHIIISYTIIESSIDSTALVHFVVGANVNDSTKKLKPKNNTGFYYGIRDDIFFPGRSNTRIKKTERNLFRSVMGGESLINSFQLTQGNKRSYNEAAGQAASATALEDILGETLMELREMREDIAALREEMQSMKDEFTRSKTFREAPEFLDSRDEPAHEFTDQGSLGESSTGSFIMGDAEQKKKKTFESIGREVEKWARSLLEEDEESFGWKEVKCNSMMNKKFNKNGQTTCFIKASSTLYFFNSHKSR